MIDIAYDTIVHASDHFEKIIEFTEKLIKQGDMFMDNTDGETVRQAKQCRELVAESPGEGTTTSRDSV